MKFTLCCEAIESWLIWPGQPSYFVGVLGELLLDGRVIHIQDQRTLLLIDPNQHIEVAIMNELWQIKNQIEYQLWQYFFNMYYGLQ